MGITLVVMSIALQLLSAGYKQKMKYSGAEVVTTSNVDRRLMLWTAAWVIVTCVALIPVPIGRDAIPNAITILLSLGVLVYWLRQPELVWKIKTPNA